MIYCDLAINGVPTWVGVPCLTNVLIGSQPYLPFRGLLIFNCTYGMTDPDYTGFGDDGRFELLFTPDAENWETIPLKAIPSQQFDIDLNGQNCTLSIYQKDSFDIGA